MFDEPATMSLRRSRTARIISVASVAGIADMRKISRASNAAQATSPSPISGPSTAPTESIARSKPNARPRRPSAEVSTNNASRGEVRMPFPNRSANRAANTTGHTAASASIGLDTAVSAYPTNATALRRRMRSETQPETPLTTLAEPTARPSIKPTTVAGARNVCVRNTGRIG